MQQNILLVYKNSQYSNTQVIYQNCKYIDKFIKGKTCIYCLLVIEMAYAVTSCDISHENFGTENETQSLVFDTRQFKKDCKSIIVKEFVR